MAQSFLTKSITVIDTVILAGIMISKDLQQSLRYSRVFTFRIHGSSNVLVEVQPRSNDNVRWMDAKPGPACRVAKVPKQWRVLGI